MANKRNLSLPLSVALVCLVIIGTMLMSPPAIQPQAAPLGNATQTAYAFVTATVEEQTRQGATQTAAYPLTETAQAMGTSKTTEDTPTTTNTNTNTPTNTHTNTPEDDAATISEATNTPTDEATNTPTHTPTPGPTPESATPTPTPEATQEITQTQELFDCPIGESVIIKGNDAPPLTSLVLFIGREEKDDRVRRKEPYTQQRYMPIGGGTSDFNGHYTLSLVMGEEAQPQTYDVHIRVRDNLKLVRKLKCRVEERSTTWELDEY